ncbi:MAG TPA: hypothetical protein VGX23_36330 [Actinocrinis sp.]|nr:hypothetical protein [Actinocrinis sp.]
MSTGFNVDPQVLAFQRMVHSAPSLRLRILEQSVHSVDALAAAFAEQAGAEAADVIARVAASQIRATETELVLENVRRLTGGESAADVYPDAVAAAQHAFGLLQRGLGDCGS